MTDSTPTAFREEGIVAPAIATYLGKLNWHPDSLQAEMYEHGRRDGVPIVSNDTGLLLALLVKLHRPRHIVEFGTAIGYSTLFMARALQPTGMLTSFEIDPERHAQAREYLGRGVKSGDIEATLNLRLVDAREGVEAMSGGIDFTFLDAAKDQYRLYLDLILQRMSPGGLVIVDNALMSGTVATGESDGHWGQKQVDDQQMFNERFVTDERLRDAMILPVGDGVAIAQRR